jgi:hypothetical protein
LEKGFDLDQTANTSWPAGWCLSNNLPLEKAAVDSTGRKLGLVGTGTQDQTPLCPFKLIAIIWSKRIGSVVAQVNTDLRATRH